MTEQLSDDPETASGKVQTGNGKPETGNRKPPRQGAAAGDPQPKPETGNQKPEAAKARSGSNGPPAETGNRKFWFLDSKPESGFDSGLDLVRNGLRVITGTVEMPSTWWSKLRAGLVDVLVQQMAKWTLGYS